MRPYLRLVAMPPETPKSAHATLVTDARVEQALRHWLQSRVPAARIADMIQDVLEALLRHANPPDTLNGVIALGRRILQNDLTDHYRHRGTVRQVEVCPRDQVHDDTIGPYVPADAWDPVDVQKRARLVNFLVAQGKLTEDDVDILERAEHEQYVALAQEFGTNEQALRVRVHRKRSLLRERWARYVAFGIPGLALVILIVYSVLHRREQEAHRLTPDTDSPYQPSLRERAAMLRRAAYNACSASQWNDCIDKLDKARELDPAGDTDPNVVDLRFDANSALHPAPVESSPDGKPRRK
jgi:DNA-directed RNA polymerase specialized sigma24 family protein